eukprot:TRINITY_DN9991_c0_g1_i1.p1 TRINITY_DN9991_c0_g1~~TRINITY_DN9991_c0_g1_i1.p1  ORF type:complete len:189 (+),score=76.92 TRINITY_DN9991_c0_g1_i1:66-632(+)
MMLRVSTRASGSAVALLASSQQRYASLRSRLQSDDLAKQQRLQADAFNLDSDLSQLSDDLKKSQQMEQHLRFQSTGDADIDRRATGVNEVVEEMSEDELKENQEIIKNMLARGLRAFVVCAFGFAIALYVYREKRRQLAERKRSESVEEDVSATLKTFQKAFEDATEEKADEDEAEAAPQGEQAAPSS